MWFYVDDQFSQHKKVGRLPRENSVRTSAVGLWTLAGSWAKRALTDGWVPEHMIHELGGTEADAEALVACKLWTRRTMTDSDGDAEDGYVFVDWAQWQETAEQILEKRAQNAERQSRHRKRHGQAAGQGELFGGSSPAGNGVSDDESNGVTDGDSVGVSNRPPSHPSHPSHPSSPKQTPSVSARAAADATSDADAGDGSLPGMPDPPPRPDNRTEGQKLVDLWISELCQGKRPPNRTIGHLGREVSLLLNRDKIPREDVEAGLRRWHDLRLTPSQLANVVHELRIADTPQASSYERRPVNGHARPAGRTTERLAALDSLREHPSTAPKEIMK